MRIFDASLRNSAPFAQQFDTITNFLTGRDYGAITPLINAGWVDDSAYEISEVFPPPGYQAGVLPRLPLQNILACCLKIATSLTSLHRGGLVHGAIDTTKLAFNRRGDVVVDTLDLQRLLPSLRKAALAGITPEQRRNLAPEFEHKPCAASDFYALGIVMYQMTFNRHPFIDNTSEAPQVTPEFGFLELMFSKLFEKDPGKRIDSASAFRDAITQSGIRFENGRAIFPKNSDSDAEDTALVGTEHNPDPDRRSTVKKKAGALILVAATVWWLAQPTAVPEQQPTEAVDSLDEPIQREPRVESAQPYYREARTLFQSGNYAAALLTLNSGLDAEPGHPPSVQLKQRTILELELLPLFRAAQRQLDEQRLSQPAGDNAVETYRQIADRLKQDDPRIEKGLTLVGDQYLARASSLIHSGNTARADQEIRMGLSIIPSHAGLKALRNQLSAISQD